jgi:hypothetical protein
MTPPNSRRACDPRRHPRRAGAALVTIVLLLVVILALSGSVIVVSLSGSRSSAEAVEQQRALQLAEAGVSVAKWELIEGQDPDANGQGTTSQGGTDWSYFVLTSNLGGGDYEVTSTGSAGTSSVTVREVFAQQASTEFPHAAMSFIGRIRSTDFVRGATANLILDGSGKPSVRATDLGLFGTVNSAFGSIAGFTSQHQTDFSPELADLSGIFPQLAARFDSTILPGATAQTIPGGGGPIDWGSAGSPVSYHVTNDTLDAGRVLTGYGTLVVTENFTIRDNAAIVWNGDVFVSGRVAAGPDLTDLAIANGGSLTVTGNLVVLGHGDNGVQVIVQSGSGLVVNGSVLVSAEFAAAAQPTTRIEFQEGSSGTVNGLFTLLGREFEAKFKDTSDVEVTGMFQVATPVDDENNGVKLEFLGDLEVHRSLDKIKAAAAALSGLQSAHSLDQLGKLVDENAVNTKAWRTQP